MKKKIRYIIIIAIIIMVILTIVDFIRFYKTFNRTKPLITVWTIEKGALDLRLGLGYSFEYKTTNAGGMRAKFNLFYMIPLYSWGF